MVRIAMARLQNLGCVMDLIIGCLVHVDTIDCMTDVKLFAEIALMGTDFSRVLRPMLHQWKKVSKHDRALIRQVNQRMKSVRKTTKDQRLFFGFHDMWILEFALGLSRGHGLCFQRWMVFPTSWMASRGIYKFLDDAPADGWLFPLSITDCLSPEDKKCVSTLCWFSKYILYEIWKDTPKPTVVTLLYAAKGSWGR